MSEPHLPAEFHDSEPRSDVEPLCQLVERLGQPPPAVVQTWRDHINTQLPEHFRDWQLDRFGVTAIATLVRLDREMSAPANQTPAIEQRENNDPLETVDEEDTPAGKTATPIEPNVVANVEPNVVANVEPNVDASVTDAIDSTPVARAVMRSPRRTAVLIVVAGLAFATSGLIIWATGPLSEAITRTRDDSSTLFEQQSKIDNGQPSNRLATASSTTEPVESLSLIQDSADVPSDDYAIHSLTTPTLDPTLFALDSLMPSTRTDASIGTSATDTPLESIPKSPTSMDDVLSAGEDDPPPETPQPVRELALPVGSKSVVDSPTGAGSTSEAVASSSTAQADPLAIKFDVADQQPSWDLHQPIPTSGVHLSVSLELPEGINQGWIEPLDEASPRRSKGIAVLTPMDEESVAIGLRMDVRCGTKLSIRIRYAARLDPMLPWQPFTRDALLKSADYFGQQSLLASTQAEQLEALYSKSDTYGRRALRDQRDIAKVRVENLKLILKRMGELDSLAEKIETDGFVTVTLIDQRPDGEHTILETVATEAISETP